MGRILGRLTLKRPEEKGDLARQEQAWRRTPNTQKGSEGRN